MENLYTIEEIRNNLPEKYKEFKIDTKFIKANLTGHISYIPKITKCGEITSILKICDKFKELNFLLEKKLDGILINIIYYNGILVSAITKGNRHGGKNITQQIKNHKDIPNFIENKDLLEVRGEIVLSIEKYKNKYSHEFIDSRTTVSGNINKKNIEDQFIKDIDIYVHDISIINKDRYFLQSDIYKNLNKYGFKTINYKLISYEQIESELELLSENLNTDIYMCDGCILKLDNIEKQIELLGINTKITKHIIAFKINKIIVTKIRNINFVFSKDASILPTIEIDPVTCDDKVCKSLTIYSYDILLQNNIQPGDKVKIKYNTTFVYDGIAEKNSNTPFTELKICFSCNSKLTNIGKKIYCENQLCKGKNIAILYSYAKLKGIKSIGLSIISELIKQDIIYKPIDILDNSYNNKVSEFFQDKKNFGNKKIQNIIDGLKYIQNNMSNIDILILLGISGLGQETARKLAPDLYYILDTEKEIEETVNKYAYLNKLQKLSIVKFFRSNQDIISKARLLLIS